MKFQYNMQNNYAWQYKIAKRWKMWYNIKYKFFLLKYQMVLEKENSRK